MKWWFPNFIISSTLISWHSSERNRSPFYLIYFCFSVFICLYHHRLLDSYVIWWVRMCNCYSDAKILPDLASVSPFVLASVLRWHSPLFFEHFFTCCHRVFPIHLQVSSPVWNQPFFPKDQRVLIWWNGI